MTRLITDVMSRCPLPHRPQQRVGNPLQQVVFRLLALNLPTGRRKRPYATPIRLPASLIADAVRRGKQTRMNKGSIPANPLLWLVMGMAPRAGVAPGRRINHLSNKPKE